jgi:phage baseplate assembly protein gpV
MGRKNLLSDTDYTSGKDNRYRNAVLMGFVSKIECTDKHSNVRVIMPDRLDHNDVPLITKPVPVLQIASTAKKTFAVPRLNDCVALMKMPNSTSDYFVIGSFYTPRNPPPVKDPKLDYTEWEGGHKQTFDANTDDNGNAKNPVFLTQDFKAGWLGTFKKDVNLNTTDAAKFNIKADGDVLINSANGNIDIKSPSGTITIEQTNIVLKGTVVIQGNISHTGDMVTSGHHTDAAGHHTGTTREELEQRLAALESRVAVLEARHD